MMAALANAWAWVLEHWPWLAGGTGALLLLGALVVLNPAAALGLASQVVGLLLDWLRRGLAWLRKPGSGIRACCVALALVAAYGLLSSYRANQRVVVITRDLDSATEARDRAKGRVTELEASVFTYQRQEQAYADIQRGRTEALERLQRENASVLAMLALQREQAERNSKAWWSAYAKRPDSCKAAQEALDVACAGIGDF